MVLPEAISRKINGIRPRERIQLRVSNAAYYADTMTIESFNDLISLHISIVREKYGYVEAEHEDWVCSHHANSQYEVIDEALAGDTRQRYRKEVRLLDSWTLKMPVSFVPSEVELHKEMEWREEYRPILTGLYPRAKTIEELQECYITASCMDVKAHSVLLEKWASCNRPTDQEGAASTEGLPFFRQKAREQLANMLDAATTLEKFMSWEAPKFLRERASRRLCMEEKIHTQIKHAMRLYR